MSNLELTLICLLSAIWILGAYLTYQLAVIWTDGEAAGITGRVVALLFWPITVLVAMR